MATQNTEDNTEGIIDTEIEEEIVETVEDESNEENNESEDDELVVTIGDEETPSSNEVQDSSVIKEIRNRNRELAKKNRELEEKLNAGTVQTETVKLGDKPKLADFEYDTDKYEAALESWQSKKAKAESQAAEKVKESEKATKAWNETLAKAETAKTELKAKGAKDFDDAEEIFDSIFSVTQRGIIIEGASNSAMVKYALGKNPKKAKELAAISNHVKFAFEIAKLETQLKTSNKKAIPAPERKVNSGSGVAVLSGDSMYNKLVAEAEKTGNITKLRAYKNQQREKLRK